MALTVVVVTGEVDELSEFVDKVINNKTIQAGSGEKIKLPVNNPNNPNPPYIPGGLLPSNMPDLFAGGNGVLKETYPGGVEAEGVFYAVEDKGIIPFATSWLYVSGDVEDRISSGRLYSLWEDWCFEVGEENTYTNASFVRAFKSLIGDSVQSYRTATERGFTGVRSRS